MGGFDDLIPGGTTSGGFDDLVPGGIGAKPKKRSIGDIAGDIGVTALKGAVALPQSIVGLADIPTGGRVGKALEGIGYRPAETQKTLDSLYSEPQQAANKAVREAEGFVPTLKAAIQNPSTILTTVGEAVPQMIGGAGIARGIMKGAEIAGKKLAPVIAGAIGEGAIGAGSAAENMRAQSEDGLLTPKQSIAAAGSGLGTAVFGAAGGKFAQRFGFGDVDTILAKGGPSATAAGAAKQGFLKQVAGSGIAEGVFEELPQSVQEQMWQNFGNDKPLTEGVGNAAAMGLLAGTAMGGIGGGYNALARQPGAVTPPPEDPVISGLLANPTSTGTPSDQVLAADVERANAVAAAQANADALYQSRAEFEASQQPSQIPETTIPAVNPATGEAFTPDEVSEFRQQQSARQGSMLREIEIRQTMDSEAKAQLGIGAMGRAAAAGIDSGAITAEQILQPSIGVNNGATGSDTSVLAQESGQSRSGIGGQGVSDIVDQPNGSGPGLDTNAGGITPGMRGDLPAANEGGGADAVINKPVIVNGSTNKGPSAADMAAASRGPLPGGNPLSISGNKSQIDNKTTATPLATPSADSLSTAPDNKPIPIARVGTTPNNAEDITVKGGVIYMGKFPAQNFETGADITVGENADFAQVKKALQDGGALASKQKVYPGVFGSKAKQDQPVDAVSTSADISGNKIDAEWTAFDKSSGTLGINRADMPQIKSEHRGAMVNYLNARGITSEQDEVSPDTLKATQKEFSRAKVEKAKGFTGNDRSILVSSDGYVLDGHHQWLAKREDGKPVKVIRLNAPIKTLLDDVKAFPSAQTDSGSTKSPSKLKAMIDARLADKEIRGLLPEFAKLSGWSERGGHILRDANTGEVTGRTKWVPRADWWMGKPSSVTERLIRSGVPKALNAQPITKPEREAVDWLLSVIEADIAEMNRESVAIANEIADDVDDIPFDALGETDPRKQMEALGFSQDEINEILEADNRKAEEIAARSAQESDQPGDETQAAEAGQSEVDRRNDPARRKSITDMTPDEMRRELLIDAMTGLGNRRAYQESEKLATQVSIDADGLKWINDNLGHESGDRLLETIGKVIAEETTNGFHISGDEYVIQTHTKEEADAIMARVVERLNGVTIESSTTDGEVVTMRGIGVSFGVNGDLNNAEKALREHKAQREREGLRGGRGAIPPNAIIGKQGRQDQQDNDPAQEEALTYAPPESDKEARDRWAFGAERGTNQIEIMRAVGKALDAKLFYNRDVNKFVAQELGVTDEQQAVGADKVEGGAFGYDVYLGRKAVEAERYNSAEQKLSKELGLKVGENVGKLKLQDGKIASAATIESLSDTSATLVAKRGPQTIRVTMGYSALVENADRAGSDRFKDKSALRPQLNLAGQTPAEIAAAEAASKKAAEKSARDDAKPTGPDVTADQVDLFNTQGGLFNSNLDEATKEPWQMTKGEEAALDFRDRPKTDDWKAFTRDVIAQPDGNSHYRAVRAAIEEGKKVPAEVLADYPDLQGKETPATLPKDDAKASQPLTVGGWKKALASMIDKAVFKDTVSQSVQNDGQAVITAARNGNIDRLLALKNKYEKDAADANSGGIGAGPGRVKKLKPGASTVFFGAEMAINNLSKTKAEELGLLRDGSEPASTVAGQQPLYAGKPDDNSGRDAPIAQGQSSESTISPDSDQGKAGITDAHIDLFKRVKQGEVSAAEFKASFDTLLSNKTDVLADLSGMTKDAIFQRFPGIVYRHKNDKKSDVVEAAYRDMVDDFTLGKSYSYGMGKDSQTNAIRALVDATTDQTLADYANDVKTANAEREARGKVVAAGMDDPQTLEDFQRLMAARARDMGGQVTFQQVRMTLTPEQREQFDILAAEKSRKDRGARKDSDQTRVSAAGATTGAEIIATKHTRDGYDLFVVKAAERVERDVYNAWNAAAKKLGGWYSAFKGNGAIPGFQFKTRESAEAFQKYVSGGDTQAVQDQAKARRNEFADDRSQTAIERLNEMAGSLEAKADTSLSQDRKENTSRRARIADRAEASANSDKAMAQTMRNIAAAIEGGTAKLLDRVRQKIQVEILRGFMQTAQSDKLRALYPSYAEQEKRKGEKPDAETADYVTFPTYTAFRSDLASLGRSLLEVEGTKKLGQRLMKVADDVSDAYLKFAKDNLDAVSVFRTKEGLRAAFPSKAMAEASIARSGYKGAAIVLPVKRNQNQIILSPSEAIKRGVWVGDNDKRITLAPDLGAEIVEKMGKAARRDNKYMPVPWQLENAYNSRKRLAGMGIETPAELRAAVREFISLRAAPKEADKIKVMERAMIGRRNDGLDFFPTPASVADEMVEAAGIQSGMRVLEPSAGMGHIAERIRDAGVDPDVVEMASDRRELLEAKGFNLVGNDFMDMAEGQYDRIIMNPPFSDRRDAEHVQRAFELLKPGGRLVALMGEGVFFGKDKRAESFRDWMAQVGATDEKLDEGTFMDAGLPVNTGVNARMVVIDKPGPEWKPSDSKETDTGTAMFQPESAYNTGPFYSQLSRAIESAPDKVFTTATQFKLWLNSNAAKLGVKKDEIVWSGIEDFLDMQGKGKVSKADVVGFLSKSGVRVDDTVLGNQSADQLAYDALKTYAEKNGLYFDFHSPTRPGYLIRYSEDGSLSASDGAEVEHEGSAREVADSIGIEYETEDTKFASHIPPGGIAGTYREILVTLPEKEPALSSHGLSAEYKGGGAWKITDSEGNQRGSAYGAKDEESAIQDWINQPGNSQRILNEQKTGNVAFRSSHFDQPNILVHLRTDEVTGADGKRYMRVIEVQSDWGQKGKKEGFSSPENLRVQQRLAAVRKRLDEIRNLPAEQVGMEERELWAEQKQLERDVKGSVPAAPFVTDTRAWVSLGIKRAIQHAVSSGVDGIVFATGRQNADLYDLSKQLKTVKALKSGDGYHIFGTDNNDNSHDYGIHTAKKLPDVVGKDLAEKIVNQQTPNEVYRGLDLKVGGEGMRKFYDSIVPSVANDVLKKLGGGKTGLVKVNLADVMAERNRIALLEHDAEFDELSDRAQANIRAQVNIDGLLQPGFLIPESLKAKVQTDGLPLFQPDGSYDPYQTIETRPNTTPKQLSVGRAALNDAEKRILGQNAEGFELLGSNISADFRANGGTSLIGKEVTRPEDLAFAAQVLRDPRFETFRVFYTDPTGKIVGERAYSSRLAGAVYLPENHAAQIHIDMRVHGAAGYWLMHNHPSGSAEESRADLKLTASIAKSTPGFKGHVVIDHNEYNHISVENGIAKPKLVKAPQLGSIDLNANQEVAHPLLGEKVSGPAALAAISKRLQTKDGYVVLVGTNGQQKISLLTEVPASYLKGIRGNKLKGLRAVAAIKRATGETGSTNLFAAVPGDVLDYGILLDSGILRDVVSMNGGESAANQGLLKWKGVPVSNVARSGGKGYVAQPAQKQTDTEAFKRWFGESKAVDADGKPLVLYHGTKGDFNTFASNEKGYFFTAKPARAAAYMQHLSEDDNGDIDTTGTNIMPVYLSLQNPLRLNVASIRKIGKSLGVNDVERFVANVEDSAQEDRAAVRKYAEENGHDGMILMRDLMPTPSGRGDWGFTRSYVVFRPAQIKSAIGNNGQFDPSNPSIVEQPATPYRIVGDSGRKYTPAQQAAMNRTGSTVTSRVPKDVVKSLWQDAGKKLAQGLVDQFRPVRDLSNQAYTLLRLSKGATGAFEAFLHHGKLKLRDGAYDAGVDGGVLETVFFPLGKESTDFLRWVAGNRAERLMTEGKENLFLPEDIAAFKSLADGQADFDYTLSTGKTTRDRQAIYRDSLVKFNGFNKNVLDMAEQSGLIDGDSRKLWEHEFYVPFYRAADDKDGGVRGMNIKTGVVRQQAFKKLKGGEQQLNDLLENTLMNWAHLIDASAKNRAATATLEAAAKVGAAHKAAFGEKNTVWFMKDGKKVEYTVDDPYLLEAINSLEYAGLRGPAMDAMTAMKNWLTIGVTASPFFKVRNLIRDSVQAIAAGDLSYNPAANVVKGFKLTDRAAQEYVSALAGGGLIRFGTMLEGNQAKRTRQLISAGTKNENILDDDDKVRAFYDRMIAPAINAYNEIGNRGEEINRMALYDTLIKQGKDHATANLMARDLMDFSMSGTWTSVRFLTQIVPFMNARMQGLYKLGRAAKDDPARFAIVLGGASMASLMLLAAYGDDDDWKKREDWDRDNYWWFKFGGEAYRIPKPFEIGAIATLTERTAELLFDNEMTGERFRKVTAKLAMDQLAMNPVPQLFKPIIDLYANNDSFTGRAIETPGMEKLDPEYRFNQRTSMIARGISTASGGAASPVQVDHVVRAYFGWLGSFSVGMADTMVRSVSDEPTGPTVDYWKTATGGMVSGLDSARSRYVSQMYDQAREVEQAYGTWRNLIKQGKTDEAAEYRTENSETLKKYSSVEFVKRQSSRINERIRQVERSDMSGDAKRTMINELRQRQDVIARRLSPGG